MKVDCILDKHALLLKTQYVRLTKLLLLIKISTNRLWKEVSFAIGYLAKGLQKYLKNIFVNIVPNWKMPASNNCNKDLQKANDPVPNSTSKYKYHPNIVMIKRIIEPQSKFSFTSVQYEDILREIKSLNVSKA